MNTFIDAQKGQDISIDFPFKYLFSLELEKAIAKFNMSEISICDIFLVLLEIEKRNEKLYYLLADIIKEKKIKNLYIFLAAEQNKHFNAFWKRLEENSKLIDLVKVLKNFNINKINTSDIFFDLKILEGKSRNLSDINSVYDFAISNVLDQILFYQKIKESMAKEFQLFFVNEIIDEEYVYFKSLLRMKLYKSH